MGLPLRFAAGLASLRGWRRVAAAVGAGLLAVTALPPVHFVLALFVALPMLLWLLDGVRSRKGAFAVGWAFGFGFWAAGLYWIANALLIDAARFGWMVPFAIGGLAAVLAVYQGLTALAVHLTGTRGSARVAAFAALWTLAEMLRGWALTGFAWNPLATVWMPVDAVVQPVAWIGTYGLSLVTALVAALPYALRWKPLAAGVAALAVLAGAGAMRLPQGPAPMVPDVRLRIVQPSIPQALKWEASRREANLMRHLELTAAPPQDGPAPTHVIWGETALPFALDGETDGALRALIGETLQQVGARALITGVVRRTPPGQEPYRVWNAMVALDTEGRVRATFDKAHLVPFGEYVPLRGLLPLEKITAGSTDFSAGPGPRTVPLPGLPAASPLICYEVIFPGAVTDRDDRPGWLLNVTNDSWYGLSAGPYQHFATSRLRAAEEGLPLVRAANTGISAVVDPYGRVNVALGLGVEGVVDSDLPRALPPTIFARWGNTIPALLSLAFLGLALLDRVRRGRHLSIGTMSGRKADEHR